MKKPPLLLDTESHHNAQLVSKGEDSHFSMSPCHCCGSRLGGDRHDCLLVAWNDSNGILEELDDSVSVCTDCLMNWC